MKIKHNLLPLFLKFINDSKSGRRLKKDGSRIGKGSIKNYERVYKNLIQFQEANSFEFRGCLITHLNSREFKSEKNYWKKFYKNFTTFLYKRGCYDNYVGQNIKVIRTFINYLRVEKGLDIGEFYKQMYVRKEEISIIVLTPGRLKFLIKNKDLENKLSEKEKIVKDIFVFGCTTGLRYSDIMNLTIKNFSKVNEDYYFNVTSKKTKSRSSIKLPEYAVLIYKKYRSRSSKTLLFKKMSLNTFNELIKKIGEKAGFIEVIQNKREVRGSEKNKSIRKNRFCDKMSSHMMRRTAITTLLIMGMPEILVRKISGHKDGSKSFFRYVDFARTYFDKETEKAFDKLVGDN